LGLVALALAVAPALGANDGVILSLSAIGASKPGDPIQISSSVQANSRINNSNLFYTVTAPSGAVVAQRTVDPGRMDPGQVFNDSWSTSNTPETGTYTVALCWSTGNSTNCDIASASTQFYSVPSLGWPLTMLGVGLIALWVWRNRRALARAEAR
jgi:hypothetical protein